MLDAEVAVHQCVAQVDECEFGALAANGPFAPRALK